MIRLLVLDVDGTMTDGGIYYDSHGTEIKKFAARDGAGLLIARSAGIKVMICTGRESEPVRRRAAELKLDYVYQNVRRKSDFLREFMAQNGYAKEEVAYCGDDINDLAAMNLCGFVACPADASDIIRGAGGLHLPPERRPRGRARCGAEDSGNGRALEGCGVCHFRRAAGLNRRGSMPGMSKLKKPDAPLCRALATLVVLLAVSVLVWLALVRPQLGKGRSETISDDYSASTILQDGQTASQTFTFDQNLLAVGVEFYLPGGQPEGELEVVLTDADTGEELARSTGVMGYILPDQYTVLGLDREVQGAAGRRYQLSLTPHYTGSEVLAIGHSSGVALWQDPMLLDGSQVDGTMAVQVTWQRIGGYLTRFFLLICGFAALLAAFTVWAVSSRRVRLPRLVFVLVLGLGVLYSFVLPPYAAPDEKYHINQSFTLACRWANFFSDDGWQMGHVPTTTSFRRETDVDTTLQDENTTVFTWQEFTDTLFTTTDASFDSHQEYAELQTDQNPLLYLASGAAVFVAYLFHLGFTPALALGRLANLLLFAALASWAVKVTPWGKRIFAAVALLPMTLHLAASFSRDAPLLGLCFAFTALVLDAAFGAHRDRPLPSARLAALLLTGVLLAPGKMVYLPLAALLLLVPGPRLGHHAKAKKAAYLAVCVALALVLNTGTLTATTGTRLGGDHGDFHRGGGHGGVDGPARREGPSGRAGCRLRGSDLRGKHAGKLRAASLLLRRGHPRSRPE